MPRNCNQLVIHSGWYGLLTSLISFVLHGDDDNDALQYVENGNVLDESGDNFVIHILEQLHSKDAHVLKIVADQDYLNTPAVTHNIKI